MKKLKRAARTLRLPPDLDDAIEEAAYDKSMSQNALIVNALRVYGPIKKWIVEEKANGRKGC